MADERHDPLGDVINLLAAPLAGSIRTYEQFRKGIDELFRAVDNLNTTMENLNETAERVNRLLADVEEPVRAMAAVPHRIDELVGIMGDMSRRLGPLASFAESAGGMFGLRMPTGPSTPVQPPPAKKAAAKKKAPATKAAAKKKSPAKKRS